jgi:hypothetical protein
MNWNLHTGMIVAQTLTDQDTDDPSQVAPLLDQFDEPIGQVTADGAYDGAPTYQTIAAHGGEIDVVIPPRSTAVRSGEPGSPTQRDRHLAMIAERGRLAWQATVDILGRNDDGSLQVADWTAVASPRIRWPADRGCHRRGCVEPDVGGWAPGLRPSPTGHRIAACRWESARSGPAECTNASAPTT